MHRHQHPSGVCGCSQRRRDAADGGFTLVEVVVAMSLFAVAATVILGLLVQTTGVARGNSRRTTAANLAQTQIEAARALKATAIPDGLTTSFPTVNGTMYTVKQVANYVPTESSTSVCTGSGSSLAYKLVTVTVTWTGMGATKPVRADTLKNVGLGTDGLDATTGTLAVQVNSASGSAQSGVTVVLGSGPTNRVTGDDGCAVFTGLAPGNYTVSSSMTGYAGTGNVQAVTTSSVAVTAGGISRRSLDYDAAASLAVALDAPTGSVVPSALRLRVGDTYLSEYSLPTCTGSDTSACTTGVPGTISGLFPETYTVKVGACTETDPSSVRLDLKTATGSPPAVTLPVAAVKVVVQTRVTALPVTGRTVTVAHTAGCTETYSTTSVSGGSSLVLPYGTWLISVNDTPTGGPTISGTVTVNSTNKTPTLVLAVAS